MNVQSISKTLRIVFGTMLLGASILGSILSFKEGDKQTGFLMIAGAALAAIYLYAVLSGKKGFGRV